MSETPKPASAKTPLVILALAFIGGIAAVALLNVGLAHSNRMELCISCHRLQVPYAEYRESIHYNNRTGVQAACADCHVPKEFIPKMLAKIQAIKDIYHEFRGTIDTPEKFEAHRWELANRVWARMKANDSATCRSCHDFDNMDLSAQTRFARSRHSAARDRGQTCIDCHKGIAHKQPYEPDDSAPKPPDAT